MSEYETGYQALGSYYDDDQEAPPTETCIHVTPDQTKARWNHIEDLDEFFTRIYLYHQRSGFICMVLQDILQLFQFAFVVLFSVFLMNCVDYDVLFYEKHYNSSHKVTLGEAVVPMDVCVASFSGWIIVCLLIATLFWIFRLIKAIYNILKYLEIRSFYIHALKIKSDDLPSMTWHEVQRRLLEVQKEQQMCIHKQELTELDIYHRILRFKNYMISMVNKSLMPLKCRVPLLGDCVFISTGLKYNLEMILFWGPWAPFENNWHLKSDYKSYQKRKKLAADLSSKILWIGIANFLLSPVIFLWQILYSFFRYAEVIKREPGVFGARKWSLYARLYLRHFNELDHEFNARLNRGYRPAEKYMNIFTSPVLVILAKYAAFFAGSILAVLVILTVIDEDFLAVQNIIATMTGLTVTITICRTCVPDEHMIWCPETLMKAILGQIHYIPDSWKGNAHTLKVKNEFSLLFQYKAVYLIEELLSPILTPFFLCFRVRHKALEIVDFYRNFTVEVTGVGDVCSFSQMDIRKHGNPQWVTESQTEANQYQQAEDGKTELSLMHFTLTNPEWRPPDAGNEFINNLKEQAQRDAAMFDALPPDHPLINSLHSLTSMTYGGGYNSMMSSLMQQSLVQPSNVTTEMPGESMSQRTTDLPTTGQHSSRPPARGGLRNAEGPLVSSSRGILGSIQTQSAGASALGAFAPPASLSPLPKVPEFDEATLEQLSTEMSFSAIYMHELHRRRVHQPYYDNFEELHERALWQLPEETTESGTSSTSPMAQRAQSTVGRSESPDDPNSLSDSPDQPLIHVDTHDDKQSR